ncbi:right-handed parallel beta-helix repeat-containing protein [Candidatus Latescibacterota bacterium]
MFDRIGRPISRYKGIKGKESIEAFGSVYQIQLLYNGIIDRDATIFLRSEKLQKSLTEAVGVKENFEEIPKIEITIPLNTEKGLQRLREDSVARLHAKGGTGNPIETVNIKMYGRLSCSGSQWSDIQLWQSGQGDLRHFDEIRPSFTVQIASGPLLYGISSFKLYNIRTKQGLLDYVLGHIAENEGVFIPRWLLCDLTINGRHADLYIVEEIPSPEFFASKNKYDGAIQSMGKNFYKPRLNAKLFDSGNIDVMLKRIDPDNFGKTIALFSLFHGNHGLEGQDIRFYLNPILGLYEPYIRDINLDMWPESALGIRTLLTYSNFWLGERPFGRGSHYNVKTPDFKFAHPNLPNSGAYTSTNTSLGFSGPNPLIQYYLKIPRYREIFDRYLLYYSSKEIWDSFLDKLVNTFNEAEQFLKDDNSYLKAISNQAKEKYKNNKFTIARMTYPLLEKSRILVVPYKDDGDTTFYALLNLSTFSVRMSEDSITDNFRIIDNDIDINDNGYFLAPSKFFAMSINGLMSEEDNFTLDKLSQKTIKKILYIELRSYLSDYQDKEAYVGPKPFIRIMVPGNRKKEFEESIKKSDVFRVADTSFLNSSQIRFLKSFHREKPEKIILNVNKNVGKELPPEYVGDDVIIHNIGQYPVKDGYIVRYLFLNQIPDSVSVNFRRSGDERIKKVKSSFITEKGIKETGTNFYLAPMGSGPFKKTTGLWIDNFIPLFNGTRNNEGSNIAVVDLYFTNKEFKNKVRTSGMFSRLGLFHTKFLYRIVDIIKKSTENVFSTSFEKWSLSSQGGLLPEKFSYFQTGSGGSAEKCILKEGIREGKTSVLLKPSSIGNSYIRFQIADVEKIRGRHVKILVWVKSKNKTPKAIMIDIQDGLGPPVTKCYQNSGDWEHLEIEKYIGEDSKYYLLTLNIKHDATAPAYFDMISVLDTTGGKRTIKVHEPFDVPFYSHDLLWENNIDKSFKKIKNNKTREEKYIYLEEDKYNDIVVVEENQVLVLEPGQVIRFSDNAGIIVHGQIYAVGSEDNIIQLLPQNRKWLGLMVINDNELEKINYLKHCKVVGVEGGVVEHYTFLGGLSFIKTNIVLDNVSIEGFISEDSIHFYKSCFEVSNLNLIGGVGDGIDSDWSYGIITESYFNNCGGDCIDISGSRVEISNNNINKAYDKGISVGENSVVSVIGNDIIENTIGIAAKDQSIVSGNRNNFTNNKTTAIASYIKKPDYIKPELLLSNSVFDKNGKKIIKESFNKVTRKYDR